MTDKPSKTEGKRTSRSEDMAGSPKANQSTERNKTAHSADKKKESSEVEHENPTVEPIHEQTEPAFNTKNVISEQPAHNQSRSEAKPGAAGIPEFIQKPQPFIQQDTDHSERVTKAQALFKLQSTVRKLREYGVSYALVEKITTVPRATAHLWASDVEPVTHSPDTTDSMPSSEPVMNYDGGDDRDPFTPQIADDGRDRFPTQRQVPRLGSEVTGAQPRIVEKNGSWSPGQTSYGSTYSNPVEVHDGGDRPVRVVIEPNSPPLQRVLVELLSLASSRNMGFEEYLESQAVQDIRDVEFSKTVLALDGEQYKDALLLSVKKANAYDKTRRETFLETGENGHE